MKRLLNSLLGLHFLCLLNVAGAWAGEELVLPPVPVIAAAPNLLSDPFAAQGGAALPPLPLGKPATPLPALSALPVTPPASLPSGLRVVFVRDQGQAVLASTDPGSASIPVVHGRSVWIAGQSYFAEVDARGVRLYQAAKGKLLWAGELVGAVLAVAPPDLSQTRFIPPLSAGVNPGLRGQGGNAATTPANMAAPATTAPTGQAPVSQNNLTSSFGGR